MVVEDKTMKDNSCMKVWNEGELGPAKAVQKVFDASAKAYKILSFTDTHLDDNEACKEMTWKLMKETILTERPDLVVLVGDNVTGGDNARRLDEFCKGMDELGVYFCPILGNHEGDNPYSVTRSAMVERFAQSKYCLLNAEKLILQDGTVVDGNGNYAIHLLNEKREICFTLIFMDSGSTMSSKDRERYQYTAEMGTVYDYIKHSQIAWYQEILEKQGEKVGSMVFCHIPLPEYIEAYDMATCHDTRYEANHPDGEGNIWFSGYKREKVCTTPHNSGMFQAMLDGKSTKIVVCGHDHINDFRVEYKGIQLCYNIPSGFSSYNVLSKAKSIQVGKTDKLLQGCSVFYITSDGELSVDEIRYEDRYPKEQEVIREIIRK